MARPLRIEFEGALYHITSRGNAGRGIFLGNVDRRLFLTFLARAVKRYRWICHAYCLMDNHYHLLIETPDANLSRGMQFLNGGYTQAFNQRHHSSGHVLKGRFKSVLVEREGHLLELARYIVLNPVRVGMVDAPDSWPWSSYGATAGLVERPEWLDVSWILSQFHSALEIAIGEYCRFVGEGREGNAWSQLRHGCFLGSDEFVGRLKPLLLKSMTDKEITRRERLATRPSLDELFHGVKGRTMRNERIHEAVRMHQYTLSEVGEFLGLAYSTISLIARRVEEEKGL